VKTADPVWYVAYGSNLLTARFHAYITGCGDEAPWGAHRGSTDTTLPAGDRQVVVPYAVFFGGDSLRWNGACCFCPVEQPSAERLPVVGRAWLVRWGQLADIVAQENRLPSSAASLPDQVPGPTEPVRVIDGVIDLLLGMEAIDGHPACTLASSRPAPAAPPSSSYRLVLAAGMAEMGLPDDVAERHLLDLDLTN
jgi:hypothetical protein